MKLIKKAALLCAMSIWGASAYANQLPDNINETIALNVGGAISGQFDANGTSINFDKISKATLAVTLVDDGEATTPTTTVENNNLSTINNSTNTVNGVRISTATFAYITYFLDEEMESVEILFGNQTQNATIEGGTMSYLGEHTVVGPTPVPIEDCNISVGFYSSCANVQITDVTYKLSGYTGENTVYVQLDDAALQEFKQTGIVDYTVSATSGDLSVKDATLNVTYAKVFTSIPNYLIDDNIAPGAKVAQALEIGVTPNGRREYLFPSINDYADVAGRMPASDGQADASGGIWKDGVGTEIPTSGCEPTASYCGSRALNVNNEGIVIGSSNSLFSQGLWGLNTLSVYYEHEFRWQYDNMEFIAGSGWEWGWSKDINEAGVIVGSGRADRTGMNDYMVHGFIWENSSTTGHTQIGDYAQPSFANAINDNGQVTGSIQQSEGMQAYVWQDGQVSVIGHLGGSRSEGEDINNAAPTQVVGVSTTASGQQHAFYWDGMSAMVDMGTFGGTTSRARAISDAGQAVGYATLADGTSHGFIWHDGVMYDLNDYIDPASGWTIVDAYDINAQGEILVRAYKAGNNAYILLSPPNTVRPVRAVAVSSVGRLDPLEAESLISIGNESGNTSLGVTVDSEGNSFVAGFIYGETDLDSGPGEDIHTPSALSPWWNRGHFVTKRSASGDYEWSVLINSDGNKYGIRDITTDQQGNLYVVGSFQHNWYRNATTGFVDKYDTNGALIWRGEFVGHTINTSVVTDAEGNVYIAGDNYGGYTDMDPGEGEVILRQTYGNYIAKLDADGNYLWNAISPHVYRAKVHSLPGLAITPSGDLYLASSVRAGTIDFDLGEGVDEKTIASSGNVTDEFGYLSKFDTNGGYISTKLYEEANLSLRANAAGLHVLTANKLEKLDANGNVTWETPFVGDAKDFALDPEGNVYVTGKFYSVSDFDPSTGEDLQGLNGAGIFISRFNNDGSYASTNVIPVYGKAEGVAADAYGNIYATGSFGDQWFAPPFISTEDGALSAPNAGSSDIWFAKFSSGPPDADVTVCPSGCDYDSIQAGIDAAAQGETILVYYGTYNELIRLEGKTLKSWKGPTETIIDATGLSSSTGSSIKIYNSTLDGFTVRGGRGNGGGGIYLGSGVVQNNIITGNTALSGAGIYVAYRSPSALIQNNIISNNSATNYGGGIATNRYSTVTILNNTITGNSANYGGGASLLLYSTIVLDGNILKGNSAETIGGGIYFSKYSTAQVFNSLITDNTAPTGGGIALEASSKGRVINSTVSNNSDGIFVGYRATPVITNTVIWGNVDNQLIGTPGISYSIIQGGYGSGIGNIDADPMFVNAEDGDYRLMDGSPAIDAGGNTTTAIDINAKARPADGDGLGAGTTGDGSDYDIGAYEF